MTDEPEPTTDPDPDGGAQPNSDTFPRSYVEKLRAEAKERRKENESLTEAVARMRATALVHAVDSHAGGILEDASDLARHVEADDLLTDDAPDPEKITAKAKELAELKPHLAKKRMQGDVGQGPRGQVAPGAFDFAEVLRRAAR